MLIGVVADTHGDTDKICQHLKQWKLDQLIFAGDYYRDGKKIAQTLQINYYGVRGNCDRSEPSARDEEIVTVIDKRFYILHGHQYGVKQSMTRLHYRALELEADVVIYGHTHAAQLQQIDHIWMINPGSASRPRFDDRSSYVLIEMDKNLFQPRLVYI
ncbi:MAG: metallophosphoesterase [Syntrophomonadaceae bacterium]|nr:metallophosphoesterase [Syntrophomonadaceae bacterium]